MTSSRLAGTIPGMLTVLAVPVALQLITRQPFPQVRDSTLTAGLVLGAAAAALGIAAAWSRPAVLGPAAGLLLLLVAVLAAADLRASIRVFGQDSTGRPFEAERVEPFAATTWIGLGLLTAWAFALATLGVLRQHRHPDRGFGGQLQPRRRAGSRQRGPRVEDPTP